MRRAMWYAAVLFICSLNPDFTETAKASQLCIRFIDTPEVHYLSLADCQARVLTILHQVMANEAGLRARLPGPWEWDYACVVDGLEGAPT